MEKIKDAIRKQEDKGTVERSVKKEDQQKNVITLLRRWYMRLVYNVVYILEV